MATIILKHDTIDGVRIIIIIITIEIGPTYNNIILYDHYLLQSIIVTVTV